MVKEQGGADLKNAARDGKRPAKNYRGEMRGIAQASGRGVTSIRKHEVDACASGRSSNIGTFVPDDGIAWSAIILSAILR